LIINPTKVEVPEMNSRRNFLKMIFSLSAIPAVLTLSKIGFAQEKKKKKGDTGSGGSNEVGWAIPGKGAAGNLKYVEDKSKVPKAEQVAKTGVAFEKQHCANCILMKDGMCTLMTDNNKKVKPTGWCPSWTNNPSVPS
jgi:hypothetical protein